MNSLVALSPMRLKSTGLITPEVWLTITPFERVFDESMGFWSTGRGSISSDVVTACPPVASVMYLLDPV